MSEQRFSSYQGALEWLFAQTRGGAVRDAERMRRLMTQLKASSPPNVVHVVGSNGKGSVTAMLAAGFEAVGQRTGQFISPHVDEFRERITVDRQRISEAEVLAFVQTLPELRPAPAFFELTLALALEHFAHQEVVWGVLEAGVGARRDATRVLENVRAVVITNVGRDHLDTLGPRLRDVAADKADAVRPGVPTVTGATGEALAIIAEVAARRRSPLFVLPENPLFRLPAGLAPGTPTQQRNQQLVAATLRLQNLPEASVCQGLQATLPARAERFKLTLELAGESGHKLGHKEVVLDGAHNPDAAAALLEHTRPPFILLFGALPKKLGQETLAVLEPYTEHIVLTNAAPNETSTLQRAGLTFIKNPEAALEDALARCQPGGQVVVAGSFYLAGQVRPYLVRAARLT